MRLKLIANTVFSSHSRTVRSQKPIHGINTTHPTLYSFIKNGWETLTPDFRFTLLLTDCIGLSVRKLPPMQVIQLSFHLQKNTFPSLRQSHVTRSDFFITLFAFISSAAAAAVRFSRTVPTALTSPIDKSASN